MATIDKTVTLPSGMKLTLCSAAARDARKLMALRLAIRNTAAHLNANPLEGRETWLTLRRSLTQAYDHPRRLFLLAWQGETLVGELQMRASDYQRLRHDCRLALGVHPNIQGQGIGKALLCEGIAWATTRPDLSRISLNVHADNAAARGLYAQLGFQEEGARRGAILPKQDGSKSSNEAAKAIDEILMAYYLPSTALQRQT